MKKIGFDIGSSSIGWAVRDYNELTHFGVVTFKSGMVKGQGGYSSPAKDRRLSRGKRTLAKVRKQRKGYLLKLLEKKYLVPIDIEELNDWIKYKKGIVSKFPKNQQFLSWLQCDFSYQNGNKYKNPYELRNKALDEKLTKHELGRVLYHLVQRRGYKDIGEKDSETKKQIERRNKSKFSEKLSQRRSLGETLFKDYLKNDLKVRNEYPFREEYDNELLLILKNQGYNTLKNKDGFVDEFVGKVWKSIIWQNPLKTQKGNIGRCTLKSDKPRCPMSHPIYEIFRAWQFINTIKYKTEENDFTFLPKELRLSLFDNIFLRKDKNFKFQIIADYCDKNFGKNLKYNYTFNKKDNIYDTSVPGMPICKHFIKLFGNEALGQLNELEHHSIISAPKIISKYSIYDLWHLLFNEEKPKLRKIAQEKLLLSIKQKSDKSKNKIDETDAFSDLKDILVSGYAALSEYSLKKIIPFLKKGHIYSDAVLLSELPEAIKNFNSKEDKILELLKKSGQIFDFESKARNIANKLIDKQKGFKEHDPKNYQAQKEFDYILDDYDFEEIKNSCISFFGKNSWNKQKNKDRILNKVAEYYQKYFNDETRSYIAFKNKTEIFKELLNSNDIALQKELVHHSNIPNKYSKKPKDKKCKKLPLPYIPSIKNPMFNKALSILRKLINKLLEEEIIDDDTIVIIEVAKELNDNNKRKAIEKYQKERRDKRDKYREFMERYTTTKNLKKNKSEINNAIKKFELFNEQLENNFDENGKNIILSEKKAIDRYELWVEQNCICMYTGNPISICDLFNTTTDFEHTIPQSKLPDNTLANQTLCFSNYNRTIKKHKIPFYCPNYNKDTNEGTAILPRLKKWEELRDLYKKKYEKNLKGYSNESIEKKNERIVYKHCFKMHYDYWKDKLDRFTCEEIKESWVRRQLIDTQMTSKFAREFLTTVFKKVVVQKGTVTEQFRKMYKFQSYDEIKNRDKHTHHAIDAAVLTVIPTNSFYRELELKIKNDYWEKYRKSYTKAPFEGFNPQNWIRNIENETLVYNHKTDKLFKQTIKKARYRGKLLKLKDTEGNILYQTDVNGNFLHYKNGNKKPRRIIKAGNTIRTNLYKDTFKGKIKNVERHKSGTPIKTDEGKWKFKTGKDEFRFVVRKSINELSQSDIEKIYDPKLKKIIKDNFGSGKIFDWQGNEIKKVRLTSKAGVEVKKRIDFLSKKEYKNYYYSEAGEIIKAIVIEDLNKNLSIINLSSAKIVKFYNEFGSFDLDQFVQHLGYDKMELRRKMLLSKGDRVIAIKNQTELADTHNPQLLVNRLYKITKFHESGLYLRHHQISKHDKEIDALVKNEKDKFLVKIEKEHNLPLVVKDLTIEDFGKRKKKYEDQKFKFNSPSDYRMGRLLKTVGEKRYAKIKVELDKYKKQSSIIEREKQPLLKQNISACYFYKFENIDFKFDILGNIN